MYFPALLQFFLDYLTKAEIVIRRDRLCPSPHWKFRNISSMGAVHLSRTLASNTVYAYEESDMPRYLVKSLLSYLWLIGQQSRIRHSVHSSHTCLNYQVLTNVEMSDSIAFYMQYNPPCSPSHKTRSTTPQFPTHFAWNVCRLSSINQGRSRIRCKFRSDLIHRPQFARKF